MRENEIQEAVREIIVKIKTPREKGERQRITAKGLGELLLLMAENNPTALYVTGVILINESLGGIKTVLRMDHMNIRGEQIAFAYKQYCGGDIGKFVDKIQKKDLLMLFAINIHNAKKHNKEMAVLKNADLALRTPKMSDETIKFLSKQKDLKDGDNLTFSI